MKLYRLRKTVLSISDGVEKFLNGLTSNTLDQSQNAFLNLHGKVVASFQQIQIKDDLVMIVLEEDFTKSLLEHIEKYARLSGVTIEAQDVRVYYDLEGDYQKKDEDICLPQKAGQLVLTREELTVSVSDEDFTLFRLKNNLPVHGVDYKDTFILNVDEHEYVSYTKGCFLGQEPVSKVHSRSKPTWKLVVRYEDECTQEEQAKMTSKTLDSESGRVLGFIFIRNQ